MPAWNGPIQKMQIASLSADKHRFHPTLLLANFRGDYMTAPDRLMTESQIPELVAELGDDDPVKRQHARLMLIHLAPKSIPALLTALKSHNTNTRWEAVHAIGDLRMPEYAPALVDMVTDEDAGVRWMASDSLLNLDRACLRPLLEKFIKDFTSILLRESVRHILRALKERHHLKAPEIALFDVLNKQAIPGFEFSWPSEAAWVAERALVALDLENN
jgi:hypothetical protein